jgi:hypothetical protein
MNTKVVMSFSWHYSQTPLGVARCSIVDSREYAAALSPDGRLFAYQSTRVVDRRSSFVTSKTAGRWPISTDGGEEPLVARWHSRTTVMADLCDVSIDASSV